MWCEAHETVHYVMWSPRNSGETSSSGRTSAIRVHHNLFFFFGCVKAFLSTFLVFLMRMLLIVSFKPNNKNKFALLILISQYIFI